MNIYKEYLKNKGIPVDEIIDVITGCDGIVIEALVEGLIIYIKFLPIEFEQRLEKEIEIVNKLKENNCLVPDYYKKNNQIIFKDKNKVFYASIKVPGKPSKEHITKEILKESIKEIAKMHKVLKDIPVEGTKQSDIDRLREFYMNNKEFFKKHHLDDYIESIVNKKYEKDEYMYIHADINFNNIFVENNHVSSFIDFTDLRVGYKEDDLGKFFQNVIYLNITNEELNELINIYEKEIGAKINKKNLLVSIIYRIIYRYFCFVKNNEGNVKKYNDETVKALKKVIGG